jgi:hypothetical protein
MSMMLTPTEQSCYGKLYSQNKSNTLLTFATLPDKWGKMAISPIREKSKIKLLFLYAYFLITLQIYGAMFFKLFVYVYFSICKAW